MIPVSSRSYRLYMENRSEAEDPAARETYDTAGAFRKNAEVFRQEYEEHCLPYLAVQMQIWAEDGEGLFVPDHWCYALLVYALEPENTVPEFLEKWPEPLPESMRERVREYLQTLWTRYLAEADAPAAAPQESGSRFTGGRSAGAGHSARMREKFRQWQAETLAPQREAALAALEDEIAALREQRLQALTEQLAAEQTHLRESADYIRQRAEYAEYLAEVRQMTETRPMFFNGLMQQLNENSRAFRQAGDEAAAAMRAACEQAVERLKMQTENAINSVVQVQFRMNREDGQAVLELYNELEESSYYAQRKYAQEPWFADYRKEMGKLLHKLQRTLSAMGYTRFFCGAGDAYDPDRMALFDEDAEDAGTVVAQCVTSGFMQGDILCSKARVFLRGKEP